MKHTAKSPTKKRRNFQLAQQSSPPTKSPQTASMQFASPGVRRSPTKQAVSKSNQLFASSPVYAPQASSSGRSRRLPKAQLSAARAVILMAALALTALTMSLQENVQQDVYNVRKPKELIDYRIKPVSNATPAVVPEADTAAATGAAAAADLAAAKPKKKKMRRFAYVYVVGGCDPDKPVYRHFLYTILVNTHLMRQERSRSDVVVFVQMMYGSKHKELPVSHAKMLEQAHVKIEYIPETKDAGFEALQLQKFRVLGMTNYDRVFFLDADVLLRGSMDYLMNLSVEGVLKKNVVFAGRYVPAQGSLFMVTPEKGGTFQIPSQVLLEPSFHEHWDEDTGWGQPFEAEDRYELVNGKKGSKWNFVDASSDQGLLYHFVKYEQQSVSIVLKDTVQNWGSNASSGKAYLERTLKLDVFDGKSGPVHTCWKDFQGHRPCRAPHNSYVHFPGATKPWLREPPDNFKQAPEESPSHFWFQTLFAVNQKLKLMIPFHHWIEKERPLFGFHPDPKDKKKKNQDEVSPPKDDRLLVAKEPESKTNADKKTADYAYAYVIGGCDPDNNAYEHFINNVLINTRLQRQDGSKADVVVFFQMSFNSEHTALLDRDVRVLERMGIRIRYIPKTELESFERLMYDKYRILGLTQYKRVLFLDGDMMTLGSLDYLFQLSMDGVLKENVVLAGRLEPAMGGLFMIAPKPGDWERVLEVIRQKEDRGSYLPSPHFDEIQGWGHEFQEDDGFELVNGKKRNTWNFEGASRDQGLLYYWTKYEKRSVSIVLKKKIENWGVGADDKLRLEETLGLDVLSALSTQRECWDGTLAHKPCTSPWSDYVHFPGHKKAWMKGPPDDLFTADAWTSPSNFWFRTLMSLNDELELGLDFKNWENIRQPLLGARSNHVEMAGTTYATTVTDIASPYTRYVANSTAGLHHFAYSYVVGGCKPEDPSYRNYFNDIIISTYLQREEGSNADVVIFVQMAYASKHDVLPDEDKRLLSAMDIKVQYIPKAKDESFYRIMLDKFQILGLKQYDRVIFMDGDIMARGNLDYLFEASMKGILKKNLVFAGQNEPANGGFFMLAPSQDAQDRVLAIIHNKEERGAKLPWPHWDDVEGWGYAMKEDEYVELLSGKKSRKWDFYGAFADQGLLFQWVKYEEKSVSIVMRNDIQNWDVGSDGRVHLEKRVKFAELEDDRSPKRDCWKETMMHKPCVRPHADFVHFTGSKKPWLLGPPSDLGEVPDATSPRHFWFHTLSILNDAMGIGLDFKNWRTHHHPTLGLYPKHKDVGKTKYAAK